MFTLKNLSILMLGMILIFLFGSANFANDSGITAESRESFYMAIEGVDWKNIDISQSQLAGSSCGKEAFVFSWFLKDRRALRSGKLMEKSISAFLGIEQTVTDGGYRQTEYGSYGQFLVNGIRDHLLSGLNRYGYDKEEEFIDHVKGNGELIGDEILLLFFIHRAFIYSANKETINMKHGTCTVKENYRLTVDTIRVEDQKIEWFLSKNTKISDCDCRLDGQVYNIKEAELILRTKLIGDFSTGIPDMRYNIEEEPMIRYWRGECCNDN